MEWSYNNEALSDEQTEGFVAFVYIIENLVSGRKYIGKKRLLTKRKKKPLKGKKRKRTEITTSDWRDYYGSSAELLIDVEKLGKDNFSRKVLRFCKSLGEASYFEAKYQFDADALLKPNEWYNAWIMVRVRGDHLKGLRDAS